MTAATKSFTWQVMVCSSIPTQKLCMQADLQHSSCFTSLGKLHSSNSLLGLRMYPSIRSGNSPEATGLKVWRTKSYRMVEFPLRLLGKLMVILYLFVCCLPCLHHCTLLQPAFGNSICLPATYSMFSLAACQAFASSHFKLYFRLHNAVILLQFVLSSWILCLLALGNDTCHDDCCGHGVQPQIPATLCDCRPHSKF